MRWCGGARGPILSARVPEEPESAEDVTPSRMTGRILVGLSVLAGAGVMVYMMRRTGATIPQVANLLPIRIHLLALFTVVVDLLGRSVRIVLLARGVGHPVRFTTALYSMLAGDGAGAITPSRAGTQPAKLAVFNRDDMDVGTGGAVLVGETLAEAAILLPLALLAVAYLPGGRLGALGALVWAVGVTISVVIFFWVAGRALREAPGWWRKVRLTGRQWRVLRVVARRFRHRSAALFHLDAHTLLGVGFFTLLHVLGRLAALPALAWGAVAPEAIPALIGWPFLLLYGAALVPTPGGGGAVEAGFAAALGTILGPAYVAGLLVWWRFYTFYLPALLGGVVLLAGGFLLRKK